jgi:hypothetical protein
MRTIGVVNSEDFLEAVKNLEELEFAKGQRDRIYDFLLKRGFDVPGVTDTVAIDTIRSLDLEVAALFDENKRLKKQIADLLKTQLLNSTSNAETFNYSYKHYPTVYGDDPVVRPECAGCRGECEQCHD